MPTSSGPAPGADPAPPTEGAGPTQWLLRWLRPSGGADEGARLPASVLDAVPQPFLLVDAGGTVRAANAAVAALLGEAAEGLAGADLADALLAPADRDALRARLASMAGAEAEGAAGPPLPLTALAADGAEVPVEGTLGPAGDGLVGVALRDRRGDLAADAARLAAEGRLRMLRTIVDTLPDPVVAVDRAGRVAFRNVASARQLADTDDPRRLAAPDGQAAEAAMAAGTPEEAEEATGADGRTRLTTRLLVPDREGGVAGLVVLTRDVTDLRAEAAQAVAEKQVAEAAAHANRAFLATTSHEIRTLMSGVTGMTALLQDTALDAEQREYVDTVRSSSDALLTIVNDVLDLSKMEAGRLEIEDRPFRVRGLVAEAVRMVSQQAAAKGLALAADVAADVPDAVHGDPLRVKQVLVNLLSNAVKFTAAGSVRVAVTRAVGDGPALAVVVADTGVGIAAGRLAAVFEPFAQADASTARTHGGTGLGLAICRRLVDTMGGELTADSAPGSGSTFRFTVPVRVEADAGSEAAEFTLPPDSLLVDVPLSALRAAVAPPPADPSPMTAPEAAAPAVPPPLLDVPLGDGADGLPKPPPPPPPERAVMMTMDGILPSARVLLAEDNPLVQKVTKMTLLRLGYRPDVASDGVQTVAAVRARPYDVILMDIMMPKMDGLEATRRIRADPGPHPMPVIIALTANAMKGDRERCLGAGCDDYLAKPVAPQVLAATIERALRARDGVVA